MSAFTIGSPTSAQSSVLSTPAPRSSYPSSPASYNEDSDYDESTLPFPTPLPRSDFLTPSFDPQKYLSTLIHNRHQTLEDLRSDLRQRSQLLNQELLDLVNGNYEAFLSLGADLKGGEVGLEGVRVGVLGFEREVEGVRGTVREREEEVGALLEERKSVRREVLVGRGLLEVESGIGELEESLRITEREGEESEDLDSEDDDNDIHPSTIALRKLQTHNQQYILLTRQIERLGPEHPFLQTQKPRLAGVRKTLLLDLAAALRRANIERAPDAILGVVKMFGDLGAEGESVRVLRGG